MKKLTADIILRGPKSLFSLFHKVKDTFFIFTNTFIVLHILSMLAILAIGSEWLEARGAAKHLQCIRQPHSKEIFGRNVNSTKKLHKPLLIRSVSHSTFSIHCTSLFVLFSCVFTFLKVIKLICWKCWLSSSLFNIKTAAKIHQFWFF